MICFPFNQARFIWARAFLSFFKSRQKSQGRQTLKKKKKKKSTKKMYGIKLLLSLQIGQTPEML